MALTTMTYIALWQFAQFSLFTQLCALYALRVSGILSRKTFGTYIHDTIVSWPFLSVLSK